MQIRTMQAAAENANGVQRGFATTSEAAEFLRLSKAMIHKQINEGKIPATRYGRAVRIPWTWLLGQIEMAG